MVVYSGAVLAIILACVSCSSVPSGDASDPWLKVELDLAQLDRNGLRGPPDGKDLLSYEFSIPNTEECKAEVKGTDPSVQFMPGSSGRIGAAKDDCLCIGTTGKDYRSVLRRLAGLTYVKRIIECHFE